LNSLVQNLLAKEEVFLQLPEADKASSSSALKSAHKGSADNAAPNAAKRKNIRPGILSIELVDPSTGTLELELAHGPAMHVKPDHVLKCLQPDEQPFPETVWRITRTGLKGQGETPLFNT
jgi:hypothetical protein